MAIRTPPKALAGSREHAPWERLGEYGHPTARDAPEAAFRPTERHSGPRPGWNIFTPEWFGAQQWAPAVT
jgi:hypothetical protein